MRLNALEQTADWLATVVFEGRRGRQTLCLLHDRFLIGGFFWVIADERVELPWQAVREFDPVTTARLAAADRIRLVKGQWPRGVPLHEEDMPAAPTFCPSSSFAPGVRVLA
jgi:hypothetical protein